MARHQCTIVQQGTARYSALSTHRELAAGPRYRGDGERRAHLCPLRPPAAALRLEDRVVGHAQTGLQRRRVAPRGPDERWDGSVSGKVCVSGCKTLYRRTYIGSHFQKGQGADPKGER